MRKNGPVIDVRKPVRKPGPLKDALARANVEVFSNRFTPDSLMFLNKLVSTKYESVSF